MTSYQVIFDKFIKKLKGDTQFFNYGNLTDAEINALVDDHLVALLNRAIDKLYSFGLPDINFYDKDDTTQNFNENLVPQEISLLVELMYLSYVEEDMNKLKSLGLVLRTSEINALFSPANDRKTYLDMVSKLENNIVNSINQYFARDRESWKLKSIYGDLS